MDEKVTWNPTCMGMDSVWWSLEFCADKTQLGCLNGQQGCPCQRNIPSDLIGL